MDSISYITKKHCRSVLNIISVALMAIMSITSFVGIGGYAGLACSVFLGIIALLIFLYTLGSVIGCTLLQILPAIISFVSFFSGIAVIAIGFAAVHYPGMYDYINEIFLQNGYMLTFPPRAFGIVLCSSSLAFFAASFFAFCAVVYLGTVKNCLKNTISRQGARIFSIMCIIAFVISAVSALFFVFSCGGFEKVTVDRLSLSIFVEISTLAILFLMTGVSSSSFISSTFAFKVFEDKMMKVETNADGTVYVPIVEDSDRENSPAAVPIHVSATVEQSSKKSSDSKKKFIISVYSLGESYVIDGSNNEYDII